MGVGLHYSKYVYTISDLIKYFQIDLLSEQIEMLIPEMPKDCYTVTASDRICFSYKAISWIKNYLEEKSRSCKET